MPGEILDKGPVEVHMLIGGDWQADEDALRAPVIDPYRKDVLGFGIQASPAAIQAAISAAAGAEKVAANTKPYERARWLDGLAALLEEYRDTLAETLSRETGKAITDTRIEVRRASQVLRLSAGEAVRIQGEHVSLDGTETGAGKLAVLLPFPVGVVAAIIPFNAPLNLAAHKLGPALAAGNTVVLKAPPQCPITIYQLSKMVAAAGIPAGIINFIYGDADVGQRLVQNPAVDFISFTGSLKGGASVKSASGLRRTILELGGVGPNIVHRDADVDSAAVMCARNAMRLAGQSCLSVQNVLVHRDVFERFLDQVVEHVRNLRCGDPLDPATDVGTLIDEGAAARVDAWVKDAIAAGAKVEVGAGRVGAAYEPTVLTSVTRRMKVVCEEVFGPVVNVQSYGDLEDVTEWINSMEFGLHCGVFTGSLDIAMHCARNIRCGGIIINGTSTFRTEQQPYGGLKSSGMGREGPHYAIREMMDQRLIVFNL